MKGDPVATVDRALATIARLTKERAEAHAQGYAEAKEQAAGVCEAKATVARANGVAGNCDPLEAQLLDDHFTVTARVIRAMERK